MPDDQTPHQPLRLLPQVKPDLVGQEGIDMNPWLTDRVVRRKAGDDFVYASRVALENQNEVNVSWTKDKAGAVRFTKKNIGLACLVVINATINPNIYSLAEIVDLNDA